MEHVDSYEPDARYNYTQPLSIRANSRLPDNHRAR